MNELQRMNQEIRRYTIVLASLLSLSGLLLFPDEGKAIAVGILIGALCGLIGFQMIIHSANALQANDTDPKGKAYRAYLLRYLMYAAIFILSIQQGANIIALLIGILAHKSCILIYTYRCGKEDD